MDVSEADVVQRLELLPNAGLILEKVQGVFDRELEHVGDALAAETDFQCLSIVALSFAHLTRHVDVGEKVHLDLHETIALTRLTTPSLHVEGEASRPVTANLRLWQLREQLADRREQARIGRRIGSRRPTDGTLVDVDDLIDVLEPNDPFVRAWNDARSIEVAGERSVKDVLDQRRLPRARDAGDGDEDAEGNLDVEIAQVVLARALDADLATRVDRPARTRSAN